MKIVKCRDLGFECDFMAVGTEMEEVEKKMLEHLETEHREELGKLPEEEMEHLRHRISTLLGRSCGCGAL
jgi:predicted small metal-binding protein